MGASNLLLSSGLSNGSISSPEDSASLVLHAGILIRPSVAGSLQWQASGLVSLMTPPPPRPAPALPCTARWTHVWSRTIHDARRAATESRRLRVCQDTGGGGGACAAPSASQIVRFVCIRAAMAAVVLRLPDSLFVHAVIVP